LPIIECSLPIKHSYCSKFLIPFALVKGLFSFVYIITSTIYGTMTDSDSIQTKLEKYQTAEQIAAQHIKTFDNLDFDVFTNQKWDRLKESHSADIIVYWPTGKAFKLQMTTVGH